MSKGVPYAEATSGEKAKADIVKTLKSFGANKWAWAEDYETGTLQLAFEINGHPVNFQASAQGWATMYMKKNPWHSGRHSTRREYEERWLEQGFIAVPSILRDWLKGQLTALESGVLSFEALFMPFMLTPDGTPLLEKARPLLQLQERGAP